MQISSWRKVSRTKLKVHNKPHCCNFSLSHRTPMSSRWPQPKRDCSSKRTAAEVVHAIETHWEVKVGAAIWRVCGHNQRTYQYLIHLLSSVWDESAYRYNPIFVFKDVKPPFLSTNASRHQVEAYFEQHFQAFLPNESDDKKTVTVSTEVYLRKILQRDPQLQKGVQLVIQGDGAGLSRSKTQVTFALKVLPSLCN